MHLILGADPQLLATLAVLGDYLQDVVLVGGWVPTSTAGSGPPRARWRPGAPSISMPR